MVDDNSMLKTEEEWNKLLTPEQYQVLRMKGTEVPGSGEYLHEKRRGFIPVPPAATHCFPQMLSSTLARAAKFRSGVAGRGEICRRHKSRHAPDRGRLREVRFTPRPRV